jgi:transglutaminase-like putative cysteine protease
MNATVGCLLRLDVYAPTDLVLAVATAVTPRTERLVLTVDGEPVPLREVDDRGTRLHLARLPVGAVQVSYDAELTVVPGQREVTTLDRLVALRPSRYCPSDQLAGLVLRELGPTDATTVERAVAWVRERLVYDPSGSRPVDSAVDTLLTGRGVCRDYAHLLVTVLRALDVPARCVSVYAPGLFPMDFHAVVEVAVDGVWQVLDATGMAPRPSLVRIATGRDAADTAFMTLSGGAAYPSSTEVWAWTDGDLPLDAPTSLA